jgi:glycosyltransferase involved in cell wall biosynthesis
MSDRPMPRLAFFADCFREVNGAALTSRQLEAYARRRSAPILTVHRARGRRLRWRCRGDVERLELPRSPLAFPVDVDLRFDLLFARHLSLLERHLERFAPDVIHITSPGDLGLAGAILAHRLGVPLVASWHTNLHEFASRRLERFLAAAPVAVRERICDVAEGSCWRLTVRFYQLARVVFAPNPEVARLLERATGRPIHLMGRGIDTELFHPRPRRRRDGELVIGYVGRLTPEKNVRALARVEAALEGAGMERFRLLIVGDGGELGWLQRNLRRAEFTGVLRGERLAEAYADMDVFVFPSRTDAYGNVVQEALASGVPAVVSDVGGPKHIVTHRQTGMVTHGDEELEAAVVELALRPELRRAMGLEAARAMRARSWDEVFDRVWRVYRDVTLAAPAPRRLGVLFQE